MDQEKTSDTLRTELCSLHNSITGRFYTRGRIIRPGGQCVLLVFILKTNYPSGRTWANIFSSYGYASPV